jgi:hypothetical protein
VTAVKYAITIAACGVCLCAGEYPSGNIPIAANGRCLVVSNGAVRVQGEARADIFYRLTPRLGPASLSFKQFPAGVMKIWLNMPGEAIADLDLRVPRSLSALVVESHGGDLEVYDLDGSVVTKTSAGRVRLERLKGEATVKSGGGEVRAGQIAGGLKCTLAAGSITVDSAGESYLETHGGEITIREATGPLTARSGGGNIRVVDAMASVDASTNGGVIDILRAAGGVTATTGGGSIQIGAARWVKAVTGTGAIRLKSISGAIEARTGAGTILLDLAGASPQENMLLKTGLGDVVVLIPSNSAMAVEAVNLFSNRPARILSDFPAIRIYSRTMGGIRAAAGDGKLNGGGPLLRIEAAGGTIQFRESQ